MLTQTFHHALPVPSHDELSRQNFVKSFKLHLASRLAPGNKALYERRVKPQFQARTGRPPADRREVRAAMGCEPYYQAWGACMQGRGYTIQ